LKKAESRLYPNQNLDDFDKEEDDDKDSLLRTQETEKWDRYPHSKEF